MSKVVSAPKRVLQSESLFSPPEPERSGHASPPVDDLRGATGEEDADRPAVDDLQAATGEEDADRPAVDDLQAATVAEGDSDVTVPTIDLDDPRLYVNRELGFLSFNRRVLEEATDQANPLLERVRFLAITASNLAEFFMVRVGGLKQQVEAGIGDLTPDGLTPEAQLAAIRPLAHEMMVDMRRCLGTLLEELDVAGLHVLDYDDLSPSQRHWADEHFTRAIFPVLTPLGFDPGRPFPHISNLSLNLAVVVRNREGDQFFARVKMPDTLPRMVELPLGAVASDAASVEGDRGHRYYLWVDQLIANNLDQLFPGLEVVEAHPFRVVRDAELAIQDLEADDLLELIERTVRRRRFGGVVRLTLEEGTPAYVTEILAENLEIAPDDVFVVEPPLGVSTLIGLYDVDRPDLKYPPFIPGLPPALRELPELDLFSAMRSGDILLHHPFDSFNPVVEFLEAASRDPDVLAIKQTLYRVGRRSPVVDALLDAARRGKQVAVLVELKARFDEESNIEWARMMEAEGVHVAYGLVGLKTHSKMALVVRREGAEVRRYLHLATGNYNATTAKQYTDLGMFTCDEQMGIDASDVFNVLTGYSLKEDYKKLLVAPANMRSRLTDLIEREISHAAEGKPARLIFKLNSLVDQPMIKHLFKASQAGVQIDLLVRGVCCLRPGVEGVSENIRVVSIVGRFLEHSRIFYFLNGGDEQVLLGSADLMPRNLNRRIEVLFPVEDPALVRQLRDEVLCAYLADNVKARGMRPDGTYQRIKPQMGEAEVDAQSALIASHCATRLTWEESGTEGPAPAADQEPRLTAGSGPPTSP